MVTTMLINNKIIILIIYNSFSYNFYFSGLECYKSYENFYLNVLLTTKFTQMILLFLR